MPQEDSIWADAIGRNFDFADAAETEEKLYEILRGVLTGLLNDRSDRGRYGGVK